MVMSLPAMDSDGASPDVEPEKGDLSHTTTASSEDLPERRYLFRRPTALQYFHNGELKKTSEKERVAGRFELFFDLLYVALIANFAEKLFEEPSGINLVIFLLTFTPAWHVWADVKENANNYYNDDMFQRVGILWAMAVLVVYGNNANFVEEIEYLRVTVASYQVIRFTQATVFGYYTLAAHHHRLQNRMYMAGIYINLLIIIPLYFESVSNRAKIAVATVSIFWEQAVYLCSFGPWLANYLKLEFTTALDINHETDRYTAFTIIVLGEFTYAILVGSPARGGLNLNLMRAVWTLVIAFCFNSMYTYNDGAIRATHPARRSVWTAFAWLLIHLPLSAGLLIAGHAAAGATIEELNEGQRWLFGGGLSVSFLGMWIHGELYRDDDRPGKLIMPKQLRLLPRLIVVPIHALVPLTSSEHINDTALLSIGAGISTFVVLWETAGSLEKCASIYEKWS